MEGLRKFLCIIVIVTLSYGCNQVNSSSMTDKVLVNIAGRWKNINTYKANVTFTKDQNGQSIVSYGELMFKKPNKWKIVTNMSMLRDKKDIILYDGNIKWNYSALSNSVIKLNYKELREEYGEKYGLIFQYLEEGTVEYIGIKEFNTEKVYVLEGQQNRLYTRNKSFKKVRLYIGIKDGIIRRVALYNSSGKVVESLTCNNININVKINDEEFIFIVPKDAQIIDLTESYRKYIEGQKNF